jgi:hypothetical protein
MSLLSCEMPQSLQALVESITRSFLEIHLLNFVLLGTIEIKWKIDLFDNYEVKNV